MAVPEAIIQREDFLKVSMLSDESMESFGDFDDAASETVPLIFLVSLNNLYLLSKKFFYLKATNSLL